jgi:hypothetical protein
VDKLAAIFSALSLAVIGTPKTLRKIGRDIFVNTINLILRVLCGSAVNTII